MFAFSLFFIQHILIGKIERLIGKIQIFLKETGEVTVAENVS